MIGKTRSWSQSKFCKDIPSQMIIKILGTGCPKCKLLEQTTKDAINELWLDAQIIKVTAIEDIMMYDIMSTPGLVMNEKLVLAGKIPSKGELKLILTLKK